jgi:hypothetical protein
MEIGGSWGPRLRGKKRQLGDREAIALPYIRLPAVDTLKRYSKALEYEYRVKTAAPGTLK